MCAIHRQTQARPIDRHAEERPHLIPLPARPFDAAEVVYRTVDAEGFVVYRQNFYAAPWRLIGQAVAVRVTEDELVIHDRAFVDAARHRLFPRTAAGQRSRVQGPRTAPRRPATVGTARPAVRGVRRDGHAVPGGPAGREPVRQEPGRTRPDTGGGLPACRRPGGAGAGRAVRRLQPGRRCNASSRRGAGPRRRWMRWPTTIRPTWTGSSTASRHRHDPPPTTKPCWARVLTMPNRPTPKRRPSPPPPSRTAPTSAAPQPP